MKRIIICLMLLAVMLTGMTVVHAAEAEMTVEIRASQTEVQVGDTVEYTVLATGSGVVAMQFQLQLPEGLSYVPNSGRTPENLAQKLGVPAADWTEVSKMFTFYNDIGITFAKGTEILRFSCVVEKEGQWSVDLYELLPFNEEFVEFPAKLSVQPVNVAGEGTSSDVVVTVPVAPDETQPTVSAPEEETRPVTGADQVEDGAITDSITENPEKNQDGTPSKDTDTMDKEQQTEENAQKSSLNWIIPVGAVVVVLCAAVVFVIIKKKRI